LFQYHPTSAEIQGQLFVGHREGGAHACGHFRFPIVADYTGLLLTRSEPVADFDPIPVAMAYLMEVQLAEASIEVGSSAAPASIPPG
jgi:hypothetical protein